MKYPDFSFEKELWRKGFGVIGIDEVGRGACAGPVGIGGVIFDSHAPQDFFDYLYTLGINDSKKVSPQKRKELSLLIQKHALSYSTTVIPVSVINRKGIVFATQKGIRNVIKDIQQKTPDVKHFILLDGFACKYIPGIGLSKQMHIIKGDALSLSIAAASIIAKVYRDELMMQLSLRAPAYEFNKNKGYATLTHRKALKAFGSTRFHRRDFVDSLL